MTAQDLDKCLKWCRSTATDLFWSSLNRKDFTISEDSQVLDPWKCFEAVHQAATTTATKFMAMIDKSMKLSSLVKCGDLSFAAFPFLCKNLPGFILASYRRNTKLSQIEEIFERFYESGFRAWIRLNDNLTGDDAEAMDTSTGTISCEGCSENSCICQKLTNMFKEANL